MARKRAALSVAAADLGGDVCENVAAVSTRPGMNRLPPLPFIRLRADSADLPSGDSVTVSWSPGLLHRRSHYEDGHHTPR